VAAAATRSDANHRLVRVQPVQRMCALNSMCCAQQRSWEGGGHYPADDVFILETQITIRPNILHLKRARRALSATVPPRASILSLVG